MSMDWVDKQEEKNREERSKGYFHIEEGTQKFVLLSHLAPLAQVFDPSTKKYRVAEEGDKNTSIKGLGWVLQDGLIKQAKLPYSVVKMIRAISVDPDWEFEVPFAHEFTLNAKGAGTKEVQYSLVVSPKHYDIPADVIKELKNKPKPEEIIEKMKNGKSEVSQRNYPSAEEEGIDIDDIPFDN